MRNSEQNSIFHLQKGKMGAKLFQIVLFTVLSTGQYFTFHIIVPNINVQNKHASTVICECIDAKDCRLERLYVRYITIMSALLEMSNLQTVHIAVGFIGQVCWIFPIVELSYDWQLNLLQRSCYTTERFFFSFAAEFLLNARGLTYRVVDMTGNDHSRAPFG